MYRNILFVAAATTCVSMAAAANAGEITPGKWVTNGKITAVNMPGMPPQMADMMKKRKINTSDCITPEEANNPRKMFEDKNAECTYKDFKMSGGKISAVMRCKGPEGTAQMTMFGTYTKSTYATTNIMKFAGPRGPMSMTTKMNGRLAGKCGG